jgi:hypothetical protein
VRAHHYASGGCQSAELNEAIGRSRASLSTKIRIAAQVVGKLRFILTPGQAVDISPAKDKKRIYSSRSSTRCEKAVGSFGAVLFLAAVLS